MRQNTEKVYFAFFILLALTLNFGFFVGDIDNPEHHDAFELFAATVVSLVATVLKFGDRSHMGAVLLSTSLVADLQLIAAGVVWAVSAYMSETGTTGAAMVSVVSLSGGALVANLASVVILMVETVTLRR